MDYQELKKQIHQSFKKDFDKRNIVSVGTTYLYTPIEDLIKGYSFDKSNDILYVTWFIMPLFPETDAFVLTYGDRLKKNNNDLFELDNDNGLSKTLQELVHSEFSLLDSICSINDFYAYFYEKDHLSGLSQYWLASALRLKEMEIYCRAYIGLDFSHQIEEFSNIWRYNNRKKLGWMQKMKLGLEMLVQAFEKDQLQTFFNTQRKKTLVNLNLQ